MSTLSRSARLTLLLLSSVPLAACVSSAGPEVTGPGLCNAGSLGWAVGQPAEEANMRRLLLQSGAGLINPIGPETITSRDLRQDRLRVFIDKQNVITAVRCE